MGRRVRVPTATGRGFPSSRCAGRRTGRTPACVVAPAEQLAGGTERILEVARRLAPRSRSGSKPSRRVPGILARLAHHGSADHHPEGVEGDLGAVAVGSVTWRLQRPVVVAGLYSLPTASGLDSQQVERASSSTNALGADLGAVERVSTAPGGEEVLAGERPALRPQCRRDEATAAHARTVATTGRRDPLPGNRVSTVSSSPDRYPPRTPDAAPSTAGTGSRLTPSCRNTSVSSAGVSASW